MMFIDAELAVSGELPIEGRDFSWSGLDDNSRQIPARFSPLLSSR